jgi:hypothetical protein
MAFSSSTMPIWKNTEKLRNSYRVSNGGASQVLVSGGGGQHKPMCIAANRPLARPRALLAAAGSTNEFQTPGGFQGVSKSRPSRRFSAGFGRFSTRDEGHDHYVLFWKIANHPTHSVGVGKIRIKSFPQFLPTIKSLSANYTKLLMCRVRACTLPQ